LPIGQVDCLLEKNKNGKIITIMGQGITYLLCKSVPHKCDHWVYQDHLRDSGKATGIGVGKIIANILLN
jgi:hypothetical protein